MSDPISCKVTTWFYRRMGLMLAMFFGFAIWFIYDGKVKWPRENLIAEEYNRFQEMVEDHDKYVEEDREDEWLKHAREQNYPIKDDGEPQKWKSFAAGKGWGEKKPKEHTEDDIKGQFRWAAGCGVLGLAVLIWTLMNRGRSIGADDEAYITEKGARIEFDTIFEVDKRKWDNKGLAYVRYRDAEENELKAPIDDLKFGGADAILERILENFEGDLVEAAQPEEEEEDDEDDAELEKDEVEEEAKILAAAEAERA